MLLPSARCLKHRPPAVGPPGRRQLPKLLDLEDGAGASAARELGDLETCDIALREPRQCTWAWSKDAVGGSSEVGHRGGRSTPSGVQKVGVGVRVR